MPILHDAHVQAYYGNIADIDFIPWFHRGEFMCFLEDNQDIPF